MFLHNTRFTFPLPEGSPADVDGGIIMASAMSMPEMLDRPRGGRADYLDRRRVFDPQLYLADLSADTASAVVGYLGSYPWFRCPHEPYVRVKKGGGKTWFAGQRQTIRDSWPGEPPRAEGDISACVRAAVEFQRDFGCDRIVLPSPMTRTLASYDTEIRWLDTGIAVCEKLGVAVPVYATIALDDHIVQQRRPLESPFLQSVAAQIVSRPALAGAYLVLAQESEQLESYVCRSSDTLLAVLTLVDDIAFRAGRDVMVNGLGGFSIAAVAAGASAWASSFYRKSRRVRTNDYKDSGKGPQTYPRYYSNALLGDVGVRYDLLTLGRSVATTRVLTDTPPAAALNRALRGNTDIGRVVSWRYSPGTPTAAMAHYISCMHLLDREVFSVPAADRVAYVADRLRDAEALAATARPMLEQAARARKENFHASDLAHQRTWRESFDRWRTAAGR